jgi:hypothetical protein
MLSASTPGALAEGSLRAEGGELRLTLGPGAAALAGEVVERRLAALGECLGLPSRLVA